MKEKISYYAQLLTPYKNKYNHIIPISKKISVECRPYKHIKSLYQSFGKERNLPDNFTELDYIMKYHEIIISYGNGSGEFVSVPCKLFKKNIIIEEVIEEIG